MTMLMVSHLAKRLNVSERTLRRWLSEDGAPQPKFRGLVQCREACWYDPAEVKAWVEPRRRPAPRGLYAALREFFENNPDEELTQQEMVIKWSAHPRTLRNTLSTLTKEGLLKRIAVYRYETDPQ